MLRRGDEELALAPQPSLVRVGTLVARMRAAGLPVELEVAGDPVQLPPGVDAAAFRIVQEALVNVAAPRGRHARAVRVGYGPAAVELCVRDDGGGGDGRSTTAAGSSACASASRSTAASCAPAGGAPRGFELRARLPVGEPAT